MRPWVIAWFESHGLEALAWLVSAQGVVYSLAIAVLVSTFAWRAQSRGIPWRRAIDAAACAGVGGLIGAHAFPALVTGQLLRLSPVDWLDGSRGTASWGAYLGALAGLLLYLRVTHARPWPHLDLAASCAALGPAIGRFDCLLAGDDFGRPSSLPWAIAFPEGSPPFTATPPRE